MMGRGSNMATIQMPPLITKKRWVWLVAGVVSAIGIIVLAVIIQPANAPSAPTIGAIAPDFTSITPEGDTIRLSDFRGQVVLLNFWATWCGPCRIEMPIFEQLYAQTDETNITILAVNNRESVEQVVRFRDQLRLSFPLAMDETGTIQDQYQIGGYPMTYIINADGVIVDIHYGVFTPAQIRDLTNRFAP